MPHFVSINQLLNNTQPVGVGTTLIRKIQLSHSFEDIVSVDNLLLAWEEFIKGKRNKKDVQELSYNLMSNIFSLHNDLVHLTYKHDPYQAFNISDPKPRNIHKASVRDRLLHHAVHRILYPFFDRTFISDSFSCRINKGTHKAINRFRSFAYKESNNNTEICYILKCDIRKFFASINHKTLRNILQEYIKDEKIVWLLKEIINSFHLKPNTGLPLGNLTSQLFANIYLNKLDQFIKHKLKAKYHIRYSDDFVVLSQNKEYLKEIAYRVKHFLENELKLELHPNKISIKTLYSGQDFLGWINFPDHRILRNTTKKRMLKRIEENPKEEVICSYLGMLKHGNMVKVKRDIIREYDMG